MLRFSQDENYGARHGEYLRLREKLEREMKWYMFFSVCTKMFLGFVRISIKRVKKSVQKVT